ncbi:ADP-heptose synthase [Paenibacillus sp. YPG26]|uniref:ADP-heptose synthase n=1 Tax=Paenibacillus sp. YPG26 TaxID=2878915 RepID=UPI00203AE85F|nr:ADP-heptose synthase [Paenibacillus sp. YPG26]USB31993.1 ADP-heptose synthase [Paenibacillus sp. YPG26]
MPRRFIIEAVMLAIYGEITAPDEPVEFIVPYPTIMELYEFRNSPEPLMSDPDDDLYVKSKIEELIDYLEVPFNRKKLERALSIPWSKSSSILLGKSVSLTIVNALDNEQYGEFLDPIETVIVLTSLRESAPVLTDQPELISRIIDAEIPVQVFGIQDFHFAVETDNLDSQQT